MLEVFRKSAKGRAGKIIVGLIVITFVLFGAESIISIAGNSAPATVNGQDISEINLQRSLNVRQQELLNQYGPEVATQIANSSFLRDDVLQSLINQTLQSQLANSLHFELSEDQILSNFANIEAFQIDGEFDQSMYQNVLAANGFNHVSFMAAEKDQGAVRQFQTGLFNSAFAVNKTSKLYGSLNGQQRAIAYRSFNQQDYVDSVELSDDDLNEYYRDNERSFMNEEQVKVNYVRISFDDLISQMFVSEDELNSAYQSYVNEASSNEEREISHILFAGKEDNENAALEALRRLNEGEQFFDLAVELSDDPGSAEFGGSLGMLVDGVFVPEFYDAAVSLTQAGEVSGLVSTEYGIHLIQLDSISTAQIESLEEKKAELSLSIQVRKARDEMLLIESQLADIAFTSDSISDVATNFDEEILTSDWISRTSNNTLALENGVIEAAFSNQVLFDGLISDVIRLSNSDLLVLQKDEYQPEAIKPFEQVKSEVVDALTEIKANELMLADLENTLQNTTELDDTWSNVITIRRNESGLPSAVVQKAFELPVSPDGRLVTGLAEGVGEAYSVALIEVANTEPDPSFLQAAEEFSRRLSGNSQLQMVFNQAKENASIKIR